MITTTTTRGTRASSSRASTSYLTPPPPPPPHRHQQQQSLSFRYRRHRHPHHHRRVIRAASSSSSSPSSDDDSGDNNNNNNNNEADMNMEVLKLRMEQLRLRETETTPLRVLVLDASLPKQRLALNFGTQGDAKRSLNCGTSMGEGDIPLGTKFAMLGMSPTNKKVLPCGVEVEVTQFEVNEDGSTFVELTGTKRFKIDEQGPYLDEEEIPHVRVRFIDDDKACGSLDDYIPRPGTDSFAMMESLRELVDNEEALHELSTDLDDLLEKWERLVVEGKREQQPNHLELIKSHLGEFPDVKSFAKRAVWVCSYINPIPSLGVAYEIRPALLMAPTVGDMLRIAKAGLELSITKMSNEDKNIGPQID